MKGKASGKDGGGLRSSRMGGCIGPLPKDTSLIYTLAWVTVVMTLMGTGDRSSCSYPTKPTTLLGSLHPGYNVEMGLCLVLCLYHKERTDQEQDSAGMPPGANQLLICTACLPSPLRIKPRVSPVIFSLCLSVSVCYNIKVLV